MGTSGSRGLNSDTPELHRSCISVRLSAVCDGELGMMSWELLCSSLGIFSHQRNPNMNMDNQFFFFFSSWLEGAERKSRGRRTQSSVGGINRIPACKPHCCDRCHFHRVHKRVLLEEPSGNLFKIKNPEVMPLEALGIFQAK